MTILDLLRKLAGPADDLLAFLNMVALRFPDMAPAAQKIIAEMSAAVSLPNLVQLAEALPKELANIASGKIDPKDHASDAG